MPIMTNDVIDNIIFSTILQIRKKNKRADIDSNIKLMVKNSDEKIINERNRNTDSYYINTELVDTEVLKLLFNLQELSIFVHKNCQFLQP